jgi:hypothetical protein
LKNTMMPRSEIARNATVMPIFARASTWRIRIQPIANPVPAAGISAIGGTEPRAARTGTNRLRAGDLLDGWRYILGHPALRPLLFNTIGVNGLILATESLVSALMLGHLGFPPWQYGLVFAAPASAG